MIRCVTTVDSDWIAETFRNSRQTAPTALPINICQSEQCRISVEPPFWQTNKETA